MLNVGKVVKKMEFKDPVTNKTLVIVEDDAGSIESVTYDGAAVTPREVDGPMKLNDRNIIYMTPGAMIVTVASPACVIKYDPVTRKLMKYCPPGDVC